MTLEELYRALDHLPLDAKVYVAGSVGSALIVLDQEAIRTLRVIKTIGGV